MTGIVKNINKLKKMRKLRNVEELILIILAFCLLMYCNYGVIN
jgi:hypothetical protein